MYMGVSQRLRRWGGTRLHFGFRITLANVLFVGIILMVYYMLKYTFLLMCWTTYGLLWLTFKPFHLMYKCVVWCTKKLFGLIN